MAASQLGSVLVGVAAYGGILAGAGGQIDSRRHGDGMLAAAIYASPPYALELPALDVARLSINLTASRVRGGFAGDRPRDFDARRHSLFLTPGGVAASWRKERPSRHVNIYFDAGTFDRGTFGDAPLLNAALPGALPLFEMLTAELSGGGAFADEAVDSLARLILVRVTRQHLTRANPVSAALMQRVTDYVEANLGRKLLVAELAGVAALPVHRFVQGFAARSGRSPHQFVLACRLDRACAAARRTPGAGRRRRALRFREPAAPDERDAAAPGDDAGALPGFGAGVTRAGRAAGTMP